MSSNLPFFFFPPSALPLAAALRVVVFSFGMLMERGCVVLGVKAEDSKPKSAKLRSGSPRDHRIGGVEHARLLCADCAPLSGDVVTAHQLSGATKHQLDVTNTSSE